MYLSSFGRYSGCLPLTVNGRHPELMVDTLNIAQNSTNDCKKAYIHVISSLLSSILFQISGSATTTGYKSCCKGFSLKTTQIMNNKAVSLQFFQFDSEGKGKVVFNPLRLGTVIVLVSSGIDFVNTPRLYSDRATR